MSGPRRIRDENFTHSQPACIIVGDVECESNGIVFLISVYFLLYFVAKILFFIKWLIFEPFIR